METVSTTGFLQIGNSGAGDITISAAIDPIFGLDLETGGKIGESTGASTGTIQVVSFRFGAGNAVNMPNLNNVTNVAGKVANGGQSVTFTNQGALNVTTVDGVSGVTTNGGDINLKASAVASGTQLTVSQPITTTANINLTADRMSLGAAVNAHAGIVSLIPTTFGRNIDIGTNANAADLGLLQSDLNNVTAGVLRIRSAIGTTVHTDSITITAPVTDVGTGWTTLSLLTAEQGILSQNAGDTLTVANLQAFGGAGVTLNENNAVSKLAGASAGAFSFVDTLSLAVDNVDNGLGGFGIGIIGGGPITLDLTGAGDVLTINQAIDTTHVGGQGADVNLTTDDIAVNAAVNAGTHNANVAPNTSGRVIDLGGFAAANTFGLSDAELAELTAAILRIGSATAGGIVLTGNVTAHAGFNTLSLITGGSVSRPASQTLTVTNLDIQADTGIGSAGPLLTTVANLAFSNLTGGAVQISNTGAVTIKAVDAILVSTNNGSTTSLTAAGAMTFAVNVTSNGTLNARTTETASESTTPLGPPDDNLIVNNGVVLKSTTGNVNLTSGDSILLPSGNPIQGATGGSLSAGVGDLDNDALLNIVVNGGAGANNLVVNATTSNSGSYSLNGAAPVPFSGATSFTFNGGSGDDSMTVNNPSAGGVFAPAGGIFFNGSGAGHSNKLDVEGGNALAEIFNYAANAADGGHNGSFSLIGAVVTANYTYTELTPLLVNAGTPTNVVFNLPSNGQDNQVSLNPASPGLGVILSQNGGFEKTAFALPSGSASVIVPGSVGQTLNVQALTGAVVVLFDVGASTLNFNAAGGPVGTATGGLTTNGALSVLYFGIGSLHLNNPAGVDAAAWPDTADRGTAFTGLSAQERFVQAVYLDDLHRAGTVAELDSWVALFSSAGLSQMQAQAAIAASIAHSAEGRDNLVRSWYQTFLGRAAQGGEEQGFVNALLSGQSEELVLSDILVSTEFNARAQTLGGATADQNFVGALYKLLLNRSASSGELSAGAAELAAVGQQSVALGVLQSAEFRQDQFEGYYNALLHRPSDQPSLNSWVFSNLDIDTVRIDFEASAEFFNVG